MSRYLGRFRFHDRSFPLVVDQSALQKAREKLERLREREKQAPYDKYLAAQVTVAERDVAMLERLVQDAAPKPMSHRARLRQLNERNRAFYGA